MIDMALQRQPLRINIAVRFAKEDLKFCAFLDLDIDSQGDGANAVMSGLDSESESDCEPEEEFPETQYIHCPEDEFGAVSLPDEIEKKN